MLAVDEFRPWLDVFEHRGKDKTILHLSLLANDKEPLMWRSREGIPGPRGAVSHAAVVLGL